MEQKSYYPKEELGWIKYNPARAQAAVPSSSQIPLTAVNRAQGELVSRGFSFEQSIAFPAGVPIMVIAKCLDIDALYKGPLEERNPWGLLPA